MFDLLVEGFAISNKNSNLMARYLFVLVFSFPLFSCFSQTEKDSLLNLIKSGKKDTSHVRVLVELSIVDRDDFEASKRYGKEAVDLATSLKDDGALLKANMNMLKLYRSARVNDTALHFASQSQDLATQLSDANSIAEINIDAGNVYLNMHNYLKALSEFIGAAHILDSLGTNPKSQMTAYANIGNVEVLLGNYEKALDYITTSLKIAQEIHYEIGVAYCFKIQGRIYRNLKKLDLAESAYKQALVSYEKMGNQRMISELLQNLGTVYFDKKDFTSAIKQYERSLSVAKGNSIISQIPYSYGALGASWIELNHLPKAKAYYDSTLSLALGTNPYLVKDSYENLALIAESQGNHKQSLSYFKLFTALSDSLKEVENKSAAEEIEAKYQNASKQNEIELLKKDRELQQFKLKRQQANIIIIAIVFVSAIIIGFLLVNRYRVMNRTKRLLEIEKVRNNIARDLHDDMGSALSSINILSQVALVEKNGDTQNYLQRIGNQSARMMEDMGDMVWSINPRNDSIHQVVTHMREFTTEILESKNIEYHFVEDIKEGLTLTAEQRKNLFLIFKETINNAAKYSGAKKIDIRLQLHDNRLVLGIKDNGQGFDEQTTKAGNGLRNLRERAKEINATLILKSALGNGTEVELKLPIA
jgi:two-component system, NarL family, sensor histidine kinase UhpB